MHALPLQHSHLPTASVTTRRPLAPFCQDGPISGNPLGVAYFHFKVMLALQCDLQLVHKKPVSLSHQQQQKDSWFLILSPSFPLPTGKQLLSWTFSFTFSHHGLNINFIFPLKVSSSLQSSLKASLTGREMRRKPPNPTIVKKACLHLTFSKEISPLFPSPSQSQPIVIGEEVTKLVFLTSFTSPS